MCGVAGIFCYGTGAGAPDRALLERMTRALAHRGPDGEGLHVEGPIALGHRRLAIVDLTETGAQPMATEDGSSWISYNGELYDHEAIRRTLDGPPRFRGRSDTETLLYLLRQRGPGALARAPGIYAFAHWDRQAGLLTLARDPLGVKQLYFHDDGHRVLFASEVKALLAAPDVARALDPEALNQYLHFHTPLFERTFLRGVRQIQPGEYVQWRQGGTRRATRFWSLGRDPRPIPDPAEAVGELREILSRVVASQLMSDVPVGSFFSGGIDSSAVAAFAKAAGRAPRCFGVHFSDQGVIDERPFQEAAARALGLELELATLDGSTFADDLPRLLWQQDQPVVGSALIPMFHVSRLAAGHVKVCLGGQGADEVFGGYARYTLARPLRTALGMLRGSVARAMAGARRAAGPRVSGNLWAQLHDRRTLRRALAGLGRASDWRDLYFSHFAMVPEATWRDLFAAEEVVSRESCWLTFREVVARSPFEDPGDQAMHWDTQTYLPALFHQDDRMSMANGLESRVPFADPRLVEFAFRVPVALKVRDGASKWLVRKAVADLLPAEILNRRKVGFDTPIDRWMRGPSAGFVRETLLSRAARERGLWSTRAVARWLDQPDRPFWSDVVWKLLNVELWARAVLSAPTPVRSAATPAVDAIASPADAPPPGRPRLRDRLQELRELGPGGLAFRLGWEVRLRSGLMTRLDRRPSALAPGALPPASSLRAALPFRPAEVVAPMSSRLSGEDRQRLASIAQEATQGRILAFGRWPADYGVPPDWHVNPTNGRRWSPSRHWSRALRDERRVGDVKLTWEIGRFPHAYHMARAAVHRPDLAPALSAALASQIRGFAQENPYGRGVHWASGQEIVFRLMAWLFALAALPASGETDGLAPVVALELHRGASYLERHLGYTLRAVYNNHLLSEALGLLLAGELLPGAPEAPRWRERGLELLTAQAPRQFYEDGGYIQQSHNYERVALQVYLWAVALLRRRGRDVPAPWIAALGRATAFLHAQQNPADGRLPNYGANDGALPAPLTSCDFSDFRPTLQAAAVAAHGERLYPPGPWDEETAWLFGAEALAAAPLRPRPRRAVSFAETGYHVLRGDDEASFAVFRCGDLRDRFSQIDMLALDVWWRGENVVVDPGSYLYNGPAGWHRHFVGTASHSTVQIDRQDQMLYYRRFKNLYRTEAALRSFRAEQDHAVVSGEHYGYRRVTGCTHRRAVLQVRGDLWVVVDHVTGVGPHAARVHWLCGAYPHRAVPGTGSLELETPRGRFDISVRDVDGAVLPGGVVRGRWSPPRGWSSRYYGEKEPVPSLAVERQGVVPITTVSLLSGGPLQVEVAGGRWAVEGERVRVAFGLAAGEFQDLRVERAASRAGEP